MSEQLLTVLKLCLLALLYLFFLRVLRAVWSEVTPPKVATADAGGGRRAKAQGCPLVGRPQPPARLGPRGRCIAVPCSG